MKTIFRLDTASAGEGRLVFGQTLYLVRKAHLFSIASSDHSFLISLQPAPAEPASSLSRSSPDTLSITIEFALEPTNRVKP
ncbi:hypothetical protein [Candidatus Binatus sp.]|jgi:hypothetical protein|uniref:hypothetical protein n=1 Tax=Candidatus Binatus sp. TaxID=2811406 RepID=UPI002FDA9FF9